MFAPDEQVSPRTSLQQQLDATFPTFRPAAHNSNEGTVRRTATGSLEVGLCPRRWMDSPAPGEDAPLGSPTQADRGALSTLDTRNRTVEYGDDVRRVPEIHICAQQRLQADGSVSRGYMPPETTLLVDAGCSMGKSTQFCAFVRRVREAKPNARVLCLSSRIIHAHDLCADYRDFEPAMYLDYKGREKELVQKPFVILSLELAFYLQFSQTAFDVLVLDEARSLCDKFAVESTIKNPDCFEQLRVHYTRATYVLASSPPTPTAASTMR